MLQKPHPTYNRWRLFPDWILMIKYCYKNYNIPSLSCSAIFELVTHLGSGLQVLELDGAELSDDSMERVSSCSRLVRLGLSFAELLTGRSLRFIRVRAINVLLL